MRWNLMGLAFAASCAAAAPQPAPGPIARVAPPAAVSPQANDGEALYRKMEAALAAAKTLAVEFTSTTDNASTKGSLKIGEGNTLELKVEGVAGAKQYTLALTCDGKKMTLARSETPPPPVPLPPMPEVAAPKALATNVAAALARGGAWLAQEFADGEYRSATDAHFTAMERGKPPKAVPESDVASRHTMSGFRLGKAEGGLAVVVYDLARNEDKPVLVTTFTVWIDSKTSLPVKRQGAVFTSSAEGKKSAAPLSTWTETYQAKAD